MKIRSISLIALAALTASAYGDLPKFRNNTYKTGNVEWVGIAELKKASDQGDALAQYTYAWALDEGKGVAENDSSAMQLYKDCVQGLKKLADAGNADAMAALGDLYEEGEGVMKDKKEAAAWFAKAVEKGHAYAMYCLADLYKDGEGVAKSLEKAKELYSAAAQKGYHEAAEELRELEHGDDD